MSWGPWSHPGFAAVLALVEERAGLAAPSCPAAAEESISGAMARAGVSDFDVYLARLAEDPAALDDLLVELTVGETYFFRNPEHFEHLRRAVLPELRARLGPEHTVRMWSAACASGEEPYSMAVLLQAEGWSEHMAVYATDVSRGALARARQATYGEWSLRGPWADRMRPHLRMEGRRYVLAPDVQQLVRFNYLNLALDTWPSADSGIWKLDVIFCRNVLIYFNRATIEAVARRLHDALADGGYLFTGPSDPPLGDLAPLQPVLTEWGVLYRRPLHGASVSAAAHGLGPGVARGMHEVGSGTPGPVPSEATRETHGMSGVAPGAPLPAGGTRHGAPESGLTPSRDSGTTDAASRRSGVSASGGREGGGVDTVAGRPGVPAPANASAPGAPAAPSRAVHAPNAEALAAARQALERGNWRGAAQRLGALDEDAAVAMEALRALANLDAHAAVDACAEAASRHPLVAGLRYLESLLLLGLGRLADAERSVRQALYLEPSLVVAWLVLGRVLRRRGDSAGALKAWREAELLCAVMPPEAPVPLADGERARGLADVARGERMRLEAALAAGGELT
ncbi:protein-glutamate O-methyltransferase CheR [Pyxidicoccus parkwayensis]|uniref:Protein-glutamate O-methyltransferase CheR n=1 Tax=Pyxidicoccus parkwayensis TaxID=2813578 RepID=A0ABX7P198_9BACT|nr:protein-glutamate O-methyltransferase CheR [Pyxidicoccus parkwaysis]QSQ22208.1 protein-glutamate O-methyltransferase CheR [Pyxidicoccus parkwaysis]